MIATQTGANLMRNASLLLLLGLSGLSGTAYADIMTGSDNSHEYEYVAGIDLPVRNQLERFAGLAGSDTIDGNASISVTKRAASLRLSGPRRGMPTISTVWKRCAIAR